MSEPAAIIEQIGGATQNDLIHFFIVVLIGLLVIFLPIYYLMSKNNRAKEEAEQERLRIYMEREQHLLTVVSTNTEALVGIKATQEIALNNLRVSIEANNVALSKDIDKLYTRLDYINVSSSALAHNSEHILELLRAAMTNHNIIKSMIADIQKGIG